MKGSKFIQNFDRQLQAFGLYFKLVQEGQEKEDIHQLRVSIKKLRAISSLMETTSPDQWRHKTYTHLYSDLFKACGRLRETQINLMLISQHLDTYLFPYAEYLIKRQQRHGQMVNLLILEFDMPKWETINNQLRHQVQSIPDEMLLRESSSFVRIKMKKVLKLKDQLPDNSKLHKVRVHQRAVQEVLVFMSELKSDSTLSSFQDQIKSINSLIGKWHDYNVMLKSLKHFTKKKATPENISRLKNLIERIKHKQETRQNEIYSLIDSYITRKTLKQITQFS